jgi:hypothetical protein
MDRIDSIPVVLEGAEIAERLRFDPARRGGEGLDELVRLARGLIHPRGLWEVAFVGQRGEGTVEVGPVVFESRLLSENLENTNKAFPNIITIGPELERAAAASGDLLEQYYLEEIANIALEKAATWLTRHLEERYGVESLSSLSPGSLTDWPITEQSKLFSIFGDTEKLIGVRLTDSLLMIPRKSISGVLFPSEEGFVTCELCDRERCPGRKAPWLGQAEDNKRNAHRNKG